MNLGMVDRILRLVLGLGFVLFDYISSANWEFIFMLIGVWTVTTSALGYCPFYGMFGVNTCPAKLAASEV